MHPTPTIGKTRRAAQPLTTAQKALLAEIDRRYAAQKRRRRHADPRRLVTFQRLDELEGLCIDNYGLHLPDDDAGWDDFTIVAHHLAHLGGAADKVVARIADWAAIWAPDFPTGIVVERAKLIAAKPQKWRADTLAWRLRLTMAQRTRLKIKTIGPPPHDADSLDAALWCLLRIKDHVPSIGTIRRALVSIREPRPDR